VSLISTKRQRGAIKNSLVFTELPLRAQTQLQEKRDNILKGRTDPNQLKQCSYFIQDFVVHRNKISRAITLSLLPLRDIPLPSPASFVTCVN
jgi:hypothetical protein